MSDSSLLSAVSYLCSLDGKSQKRATEELGEDPKERLGSVDALRRWTLDQPHIKCPTDDLFYLAFLRVRKFSQLQSRTMIEHFLEVKTKHPEWFNDIDTMAPGIQAVLDDGVVIILPTRDDEGRRVILTNYGNLSAWNTRYSKLDFFRTLICLTYYLVFTDEMTQVNGICAISDLTATSVRHSTMFSFDEQKTFYGSWHRTIPIRVKMVCFYNIGSLGDLVFGLLRVVLSEKLQKRVVNCGSVLENLYDKIPMKLLPTEYLPDDCNIKGVGTLKDCIEHMKQELSKSTTRQKILHISSSEYRLEESKRPTGSGPQESWRPLHVD